MNTLVKKFVPGIALCFALVIAVAFVRAQSASSTAPSAPPPMPVQVLQAPPPAAAAQYVVCGGCGAQIGTPQAVMIAPAVPGQVPAGSYYGMPPLVQGYPQGYYDEAGYGYVYPRVEYQPAPMPVTAIFPIAQTPVRNFVPRPGEYPAYPRAPHGHHGRR